MILEILEQRFSVCQVKTVDAELLNTPFVFTGKTDEETSLVCPTLCVPEHTISREDGWRAFRIAGVLDFSLIGILAPIAAILAENKIGIFALSTFNTDYVLIKEDNLNKAVHVLSDKGYEIRYL